MAKPKKWHVRPAESQISLAIRPVWLESSLCVLGCLSTHWACSKDINQTGRTPRLIRVFAGLTCHFVGFIMRWLILTCIMRWLILTFIMRWLILTELPVGNWVFRIYADSKGLDQPAHPCSLICPLTNLLRVLGTVKYYKIWQSHDLIIRFRWLIWP